MKLMHLLREAREQSGIKQKDLAKLMGVSVRTVQRWESDKEGAYITVDNFCYMAKLFKVRIDGVFYMESADGADSCTLLDHDVEAEQWSKKEVNALMYNWRENLRKMGYNLDYAITPLKPYDFKGQQDKSS